MGLTRWFDAIWRRVVFFGGDIRSLHSFPWMTWATHEHGVRYEEVLEALPLVAFGDVGLHRDAGYLSNVAIPGFMKHAWLHTEDGQAAPPSRIVEAVSEGVVWRSAVYPLFSDYAVLLGPRDVTDEQRKGACVKAKKIVGRPYDHRFNFNIEDELKFYVGQDTAQARAHLVEAQAWVQHYDLAFSCTEVASFCWWHVREGLRLFRTRQRGRSVILADTFLNGGWQIKWLSRSVTADVARRFGLHEEGLDMIADYRRAQPVPDRS